MLDDIPRNVFELHRGSEFETLNPLFQAICKNDQSGNKRLPKINYEKIFCASVWNLERLLSEAFFSIMIAP